MNEPTLQSILDAPVAGNAHDDMDLMRRIDRYCTNPANSVADRCRALDFLANNVMGLGEAPATERDLQDYIDAAGA